MKKGEKILLVLGALLIAAGVFVGVTLGWDYSRAPDELPHRHSRRHGDRRVQLCERAAQRA